MKVLLKALPLEAAVHRADPELGGWTITDHLLATAIDQLGVVSYHALVGPHADPKKLRRVAAPDPFPRPGARRHRRQASSEDLKRMFGGAVAYRPREVSS